MQKRVFDIIVSLVGIFVFWWVIFLCWLISSIDTKSNGFYTQLRVGRHGKLFSIFKIKTMRPLTSVETTITQLSDPRITRIGAFFRKAKLDELPQLWNVLVGDMSFVGPRPDVPGYADALADIEKEILLSVRPGITGPASLAYRNEEYLLSLQSDPQKYNDEFIYPDKVRINIEYIKNYNFYKDLYYIFKTVWS